MALLVATALGLFNGLLVAGFQINPFVATLATGMMIRGLAVVITSGFLVTVADERYTIIGREAVLGVKYSVWLFAAFAAICGFLLARTKFGRHVYAVGGNAEAARLSGIRVGWVKALTFGISGVAAGLAGLIASSRVSTGQADAGSLIELTAIAAVVIGGTSIAGGEGAIWRTMVGILLLALIGNGFNMLRVEPFYQDIVKGAIIVVAVAIDAWSKRRDVGHGHDRALERQRAAARPCLEKRKAIVTTGATADPITTEIIRNFFQSCAQDMNATLFRSAYTPVIYEGLDCAVALLDENADVLGQAAGVPLFVGNLEVCVKLTTRGVRHRHLRAGRHLLHERPLLCRARTSTTRRSSVRSSSTANWSASPPPALTGSTSAARILA